MGKEEVTDKLASGEAMEKEAGVERIAATFAAYGGPRMAVEALEELLRNRVSGPTGRI